MRESWQIWEYRRPNGGQKIGSVLSQWRPKGDCVLRRLGAVYKTCRFCIQDETLRNIKVTLCPPPGSTDVNYTCKHRYCAPREGPYVNWLWVRRALERLWEYVAPPSKSPEVLQTLTKRCPATERVHWWPFRSMTCFRYNRWTKKKQNGCKQLFSEKWNKLNVFKEPQGRKEAL